MQSPVSGEEIMEFAVEPGLTFDMRYEYSRQDYTFQVMSNGTLQQIVMDVNLRETYTVLNVSEIAIWIQIEYKVSGNPTITSDPLPVFMNSSDLGINLFYPGENREQTQGRFFRPFISTSTSVLFDDYTDHNEYEMIKSSDVLIFKYEESEDKPFYGHEVHYNSSSGMLRYVEWSIEGELGSQSIRTDLLGEYNILNCYLCDDEIYNSETDNIGEDALYPPFEYTFFAIFSIVLVHKRLRKGRK